MKPTLGQKLADKVSAFVGSWPFIIAFSVFMTIWMTLNANHIVKFDPYPFILLNLALSTVAAVQAPLIMMSQNRQAEVDRTKAEEDRQVNLDAKKDIELIKKQLTAIINTNIFQLAELKEINETLDEIEEEVSD